MPLHHITHQKPPKVWKDGFPLGNGVLGAMFWGDGNPLALTLDHAELWDLRTDRALLERSEYTYANLRRLIAEGRYAEAMATFEPAAQRSNLAPTKISIGRAELTLGPATHYCCTLDVDRGTVEGTLTTVCGAHRLQAFLHRARNLLCLRVEGCPSQAALRLLPLASLCRAMADLHHPNPEVSEGNGLWQSVQTIPDGPAYAVVWNTHGPDFFLAVETAKTAEEATSRARATHAGAAHDGFDALSADHIRLWDAFWAVSAVSIPEARMEFLWYYALYLLSSACRRGASPPGLQGLWAMDGVVPPWRGDYHADMNVQETFWPACASGHLDLLDAWCDQMRACLPAAQAFTRRFFGTEGAFWIACTLPGYTPVDCWHTTQFAWSHTGWLGWLVWLRWRYSKDTRWLAETGYPIVAELLKFYRANLEDGVDGCLHVPLSSSPEYQSDEPEAWCADPNVDLALIRRCCDWVGEMEAALGIDDLASSARTIRRRLAPYALSAKRELCLWPGKPLDESHRHPSHLMAIHPAMDLTIDGGTEARSIIDASVKQYLALGQWLWAGHTYAQLISFAAVLGRAGWAYDSLLQFAEHWIGPNGLHFNRDFHWTGMSAYGYTAHPEAAPPFTIEASCAVGAGISDMLVQGWGDIVRIFPAVPPHWRDVAFRGLLTEGAFRVSAIRRAGRTVSVRIVAGVDGQLRLRDPFGGQTVTGGPLRREGDLFIADMTAGQEIVLQVSGEVATFEDAAVFVRQSDPSRLGLR